MMECRLRQIFDRLVCGGAIPPRKVVFEEVIRVKNVRLPLVLKEYDAEIRDGIRSVVIFEPAGFCQLYHVDPKTFYRWKHAFRKPARLVWIGTRFANHTSFSRKG